MTWKTYRKLQLYIVILLDPHVSTAFINYRLYTCRFTCAPILSMGFTFANTLKINSVGQYRHHLNSTDGTIVIADKIENI